MKKPYLLRTYYALLDSPTRILLTISSAPSPIAFLNECIPDTISRSAVEYPNYMGLFSRFYLASIWSKDYPKWTWDTKSRKFIKTNKSLISRSILEKSRLAESKRNIISKIMNSLTNVRNKVGTGVAFQEAVYLTKRMQAHGFKESGYAEELIMKYPYVLQYADYAKLSLKQAADDILFKAKLDDGLLAKTELMRLTYFNKVRKATDPNQLPAIYEKFIRDCYVIPLV